MTEDPQRKKDAFDELGIETSAFEVLQRDFQEVLTELVGDKSLEKFRIEYEKLHRALKKSHESEKRLIKRCRELNAEIVANAAKVQTALKLSQEDQKTINSLKKEIEKAWKNVDLSHEKESQANVTIQKLKQEITNLSKLVEQGTGLSIGQEHSVKELLKMKEELTKERDTQSTNILQLKTENSELMENVHKLESEKLKQEEEIHKLRELLQSKQEEIEKEQLAKELKETKVQEQKTQLERLQQDIKAKQHEINEGASKLEKLEQKLKEQKSLTEKAQKDFDLLKENHNKLEADRNEQISINTQLIEENAQRRVELDKKATEIVGLQQKEQNANRMIEQLQKKVEKYDFQLKEVEKTREELKSNLAKLEKDIDGYKRLTEGEKKNAEDLMRQRDILKKNLAKASTAQQKQADLIKINESTKGNLEQEIQGYKMQAQKQRRTIYELERQREQYVQQSNDATTKYLQAMEEVKLREMNIVELQKKIAEGEAKLKQQQNLYEAVRSDRNLYSKNLIEAQDEIAEMKRKFKIMNQQIDQLKEEIAAKDKIMVKEHFEHLKVEKERDSYKAELARLQAAADLADQTIGSQQAEIQKLNHIINEADAERLAQKKEFDRVKNERDIWGTQLIRRNEELALLYEKIKIQQSTLAKGEAQYHERLEDIRILKDLKRELSLLRNKVSKVDQLKNDVYNLERQLLQERTKVKALSEELENPMNIHRWRKLEGRDPTAFEMIQKIQTLQKRLIQKTEEVVEKDIQIQEKEKEIEELQGQLDRSKRPGKEAAEKLVVYKATLKEQSKRLKSMTSQLNMYEAQVNNYKQENTAISKDLQDLQKRYYEQRRKEQLQKEQDRSKPSTPLVVEELSNSRLNSPNSASRLLGGGFNLTSKSISSPK